MILREKRISWGTSGAEVAWTGVRDAVAGAGCGAAAEALPGLLTAWWVVEATTGLTEALAGVAAEAEARLALRLSDRDADPGTVAAS